VACAKKYWRGMLFLAIISNCTAQLSSAAAQLWPMWLASAVACVMWLAVFNLKAVSQLKYGYQLSCQLWLKAISAC